MNKLTIQYLEYAGACYDGLKWFADHFPDGLDLTNDEHIRRVVDTDAIGYSGWASTVLTPDNFFNKVYASLEAWVDYARDFSNPAEHRIAIIKEMDFLEMRSVASLLLTLPEPGITNRHWHAMQSQVGCLPDTFIRCESRTEAIEEAIKLIEEHNSEFIDEDAWREHYIESNELIDNNIAYCRHTTCITVIEIVESDESCECEDGE